MKQDRILKLAEAKLKRMAEIKLCLKAGICPDCGSGLIDTDPDDDMHEIIWGCVACAKPTGTVKISALGALFGCKPPINAKTVWS